MSLPVIDALRGPRSRRDRIGRVYVVSTSELDSVLQHLGPHEVVSHEGLASHVVRGTTRPVGWLRLVGRPRHVPCGDVDRTEIDLPNGRAWIDRELGTQRVVVRTWAPRDGSELDHTLWWQGHPVAARQLHAA